MTIRVMLDTSYILPFFGIGIRIDGFEKQMSVLLSSRYEIRISFASILEAKGKSLREAARRRMPQLLERFLIGYEALIEEGRIIVEEIDLRKYNQEINEAYLKGLDDLFDCIVLATALKTSNILVTEDEEIKKVASKLSSKLRVMDWRQFYTDYLAKLETT